MPKLIKLYYDLLNQPSRAVFMFFEINKIPYDPVPTNNKGMFQKVKFICLCCVYVKIDPGLCDEDYEILCKQRFIRSNWSLCFDTF